MIGGLFRTWYGLACDVRCQTRTVTVRHQSPVRMARCYVYVDMPEFDDKTCAVYNAGSTIPEMNTETVVTTVPQYPCDKFPMESFVRDVINRLACEKSGSTSSDDEDDEQDEDDDYDAHGATREYILREHDQEDNESIFEKFTILDDEPKIPPGCQVYVICSYDE